MTGSVVQAIANGNKYSKHSWLRQPAPAGNARDEARGKQRSQPGEKIVRLAFDGWRTIKHKTPKQPPLKFKTQTKNDSPRDSTKEQAQAPEPEAAPAPKADQHEVGLLLEECLGY